MRSENADRAKTAARRAVAGDGVVKDDDGGGCVRIKRLAVSLLMTLVRPEWIGG